MSNARIFCIVFIAAAAIFSLIARRPAGATATDAAIVCTFFAAVWGIAAVALIGDRK